MLGGAGTGDYFIKKLNVILKLKDDPPKYKND